MKDITTKNIANISGDEFKVLFMIHQEFNALRQNPVNPTDIEISEYTGVSLRQVSRSLKSLKDKGIISTSTIANLFTKGEFTSAPNPRTITLKGAKETKKIKQEEEFLIKFNSYWNQVIFKEGKALSLKKLIKLTLKDRELVMITYKVLQARQKDNYRTKLSNFISQEGYRDECNLPDNMQKGQKTESEHNLDRAKDMMDNDWLTIRTLKNQMGEDVDKNTVTQWILKHYNSKTYNKVRESIKKLDDKLAQSKK